MRMILALFLSISVAHAQQEVQIVSPVEPGTDGTMESIPVDPVQTGDIPSVNPNPDPVVRPVTPHVAPQKPLTSVPNSKTQSWPSARNKPRPKPAPEPEYNPNNWNATFSLGLTMGNSTTSQATLAGTTGTSVSTDGSSMVILGGELNYRMNRFLMLGGLLEWSKYRQATTTAGATTPPDDTELGFYLLPKLYLEIDYLTLWFGLGLGFVRTSFGTAVTLGQEITSATGFGFSPRIGGDYEITDSLLVGGQFAYTTTTANISSSTDSTTKVDISRHWWSVAFRFGCQF